MKDYQKIVDDLVKKSFPELGGKVKVEERDMSSKARARFTIFGRKIIVEKSLRKYPDKILKGLFIHELSHFEINRRKHLGWLGTKLDILYCYISKEHIKKIEKSDDMLAIEKGYKKDLLLTRKILGVKNPERYLNLKEIKQYAKGIGKW